MSKAPFVTDDPVMLEGFQAVLQPGKFGYSLTAVVDANMVSHLEEDRVEVLKWCESKLKNPKRATLKPTPWEELEENRFKLKFSWKEDRRPPVVDAEGTPVMDEATPLYSGSKVKLAFYQKPYILKDGVTYGTSLKLVGVQVVELGGSTAGGEAELSDAAVADLFGKTDGYKADTIVGLTNNDEDTEDDF
jgi:hypothetical protein